MRRDFKKDKMLYIWYLVQIFLFGFCALLFYREASGQILSDIPAHMERGRKQFLEIRIIKLLNSLPHGRALAGLYLAVIMVATVFAIYYFLRTINRICFGEALPAMLLRYCAVSFVFVTSFYLPKYYEAMYYGTLGISLWHNDTYIACRLFTVLALTSFFKLGRSLESEEAFPYRELLLFSVLSFIATWMKTSFLMDMGPMLVAYIIAVFAAGKLTRKKLFDLIRTGCALIPALLIVVYQYAGTYLGEKSKDGSVIIAPFVVLKQYGNLFMMLFLFLLFPAMVLLYNMIRRKIRQLGSWYLQIWLFWLVGLGIAIVFAESGGRMFFNNFVWQCRLGNFMLFMASALVLMKNIREIFAKTLEGTGKLFDWCYVCAGIFCWIYQFLTGIIYVLQYMQFGSYKL